MDSDTPKWVLLRAYQGQKIGDVIQELSNGDRAALVAWMMTAPSTITNSNGKPPPSWLEMSEILVPISWSWQNWLPNGLLTIIAGEQGMGKSNIALRIAACFLRGDTWPDGTTSEVHGGLLWCESEGAQAVNLERAARWGLPLEKIYAPLDDPLYDVMLENETRPLAGADLMPGDGFQSC